MRCGAQVASRILAFVRRTATQSPIRRSPFAAVVDAGAQFTAPVTATRPPQQWHAGIDLHAAPDTHTYGCQWVHVRNDMQTQSRDGWVLAGDLIYVYENLEGTGGDKMYVPVGLALGSITNLVMTTEDIMKSVDYEVKRVIPVHEERLKEVQKIESRRLRTVFGAMTAWYSVQFAVSYYTIFCVPWLGWDLVEPFTFTIS